MAVGQPPWRVPRRDSFGQYSPNASNPAVATSFLVRRTGVYAPAVATVDEALQTQLRNIETSSGRSIAEWIALIEASGLRRHGQIVAMLKSDHGLSHGAANRVALTALASLETAPAPGDPVGALVAGRRPEVAATFERLLHAVRGFGPGLELAPKKGYVSLRRRTQLGMLQPAADRVDVGLVLKGEPVTPRLESAATFNALFTHRVRVRSAAEIDPELVGWLRQAWDRAG